MTTDDPRTERAELRATLDRLARLDRRIEAEDAFAAEVGAALRRATGVSLGVPTRSPDAGGVRPVASGAPSINDLLRAGRGRHQAGDHDDVPRP